MYPNNDYRNYLMHHGILGQKWGVRRYQNADGSLTPRGQKRYSERKKEINRLTKTIEYDTKARNSIDKEISEFKSKGINSKSFKSRWKKNKDGTYTDTYAGGFDNLHKKDALRYHKEELRLQKEHIGDSSYEQKQIKNIKNTPIYKRSIYEQKQINPYYGMGAMAVTNLAINIPLSIAYKKGLITGKTLAKGIAASIPISLLSSVIGYGRAEARSDKKYGLNN